MSVIGDFLTNGLGTIIKPITDVLNKKQDRKIAKDAINGQLSAARQADETTITVNDQHLEAVLAESMGTTWKDEYVTLSLVGIINGIMLGGVLHGFGYPAFLEGIITGVQALAQILDSGSELGFILKATVLAAIGLNVWRKL
jgi:hypothetical protein